MLYTDYVYPFELAAVILLVAIIAAIALTMRKRKDTKYQNPARQVTVKRESGSGSFRCRWKSRIDGRPRGRGCPVRRSRKAKGRVVLLFTLSHFLVLGALLFAISVVGIFLNRKNVIILLMAIELMLLAVNMNFVAFSHYLGDISGQVFVFFILTVAAAESAIGLAILVVLFRNLRTINVQDLDQLKG